MSEEANRVAKAEPLELEQWEKPELRKLDAADAEVGGAARSDGITQS